LSEADEDVDMTESEKLSSQDDSTEKDMEEDSEEKRQDSSFAGKTLSKGIKKDLNSQTSKRHSLKYICPICHRKYPKA
jgi:hypothetical protein